MDPFSIATGLAGLLTLTADIVQVLTDYTGGVKSATKDARSVLTEVTALDHVLQQLIEFLRKDDNQFQVQISCNFHVVLRHRNMQKSH